jgi:hypothetical protein
MKSLGWQNRIGRLASELASSEGLLSYEGGSFMTPEATEEHVKAAKLAQAVPRETIESGGSEQFKLRRWLVSFGSGQDWYPVGEFVALDAESAISRAIEVFGPATRHQAEQIPWDAAPLPKLTDR